MVRKDGSRAKNSIEEAIKNLYIIFGCPVLITFRASKQGILLVKVSRQDGVDDDDEPDEDFPIEPLKIKKELIQRPHYIG